MDPVVGIVFVLVYTGMFLGGLPALKLDRAGVALLGALALVISGRVSVQSAWQAIDAPTLLILLAVMAGSSLLQLERLTVVAHRIINANQSPSRLLAIIIASAGVASAILAENVVCLAMLPVVITVCGRHKLDPVPHLLALVFASNIGSAATVIGNPQTILIGQALGWSFIDYLLNGEDPHKFPEFVNRLKAKETLQDAMRAAYGFSVATFNDNWKDYATKKYK